MFTNEWLKCILVDIINSAYFRVRVSIFFLQSEKSRPSDPCELINVYVDKIDSPFILFYKFSEAFYGE